MARSRETLGRRIAAKEQLVRSGLEAKYFGSTEPKPSQHMQVKLEAALTG